MLAAPDGGLARLTAYRREVEARVAHDQRILHRLAHLMEGDEMTGTDPDRAELPAAAERRLAVDLFNLVWELLERSGRTSAEDDRMVHAAHASRYHWGQVGGAEQIAVGEWQCARVYSVLGRAEPALHHARRCAEVAAEADLPAWLVASSHEGLARAYVAAGDRPAAAAELARARAALARVTDPEDRQVVESDLAGIPM